MAGCAEHPNPNSAEFYFGCPDDLDVRSKVLKDFDEGALTVRLGKDQGTNVSQMDSFAHGLTLPP